MNTLIEQLVTSQTGFWREHLHLTEGAGGRLHVAWPLLRYDGWQVSFALDPGTSGDGVWRLSDNGTTLKLLNDMGAGGKVFAAHVKSRCDLYAIAQENGELVKLKASPFTPAELQLFAEAIQSLSFLAYRAEPAHEGWGIARRNFQLLIQNRGYKVRASHALPGKLRNAIEFDEVVEGGTLCACKIFEIQSELTRNLDAWAFRLRDVKDHDPRVATLLIYNPDAGRWTEDNLAFGTHIADHFLPYTDTVQIEAALHQTA